MMATSVRNSESSDKLRMAGRPADATMEARKSPSCQDLYSHHWFISQDTLADHKDSCRLFLAWVHLAKLFSACNLSMSTICRDTDVSLSSL